MSCKLSIIIVNWNVAQLLVNTIDSILCNPPYNEFEIIVIDNASSDCSIQLLESKYPSVKLIANKHNVGFSRANNQGIRIARGEYILILNPDTLISEKALDTLIAFLENNSSYGMVGPQLVTHPFQIPSPSSARLTRTLLSGLFLDVININKLPFIGKRAVRNLRYPYDLSKEAPVEVISGSAMLVRTSAIKAIGGFNESFFMAGEDVELCDRFWKNGYNIYYLPTAKIVHLEQSCTPLNPVDIFINRLMSVAKYYQLKYGSFAQDCFRYMVCLIIIPKLLIKSLYYYIQGKRSESQNNISTIKKIFHWRYVGDASFLN